MLEKQNYINSKQKYIFKEEIYTSHIKTLDLNKRNK